MDKKMLFIVAGVMLLCLGAYMSFIKDNPAGAVFIGGSVTFFALSARHSKKADEPKSDTEESDK